MCNIKFLQCCFPLSLSLSWKHCSIAHTQSNFLGVLHLQAERSQKQGGMVMCVTVLVLMCFIMLVLLVLKEIFFWSENTIFRDLAFSFFFMRLLPGSYTPLKHAVVLCLAEEFWVLDHPSLIRKIDFSLLSFFHTFLGDGVLIWRIFKGIYRAFYCIMYSFGKVICQWRILILWLPFGRGEEGYRDVLVKNVTVYVCIDSLMQ